MLLSEHLLENKLFFYNDQITTNATKITIKTKICTLYIYNICMYNNLYSFMIFLTYGPTTVIAIDFRFETLINET